MHFNLINITFLSRNFEKHPRDVKKKLPKKVLSISVATRNFLFIFAQIKKKSYEASKNLMRSLGGCMIFSYFILFVSIYYNILNKRVARFDLS
jgi:hypothetical protein